MSLFSLGTTEITPAASAALAAVNTDPAVFFTRHQQGEWGEVEERMQRYNDLAALQNEIVLSSYRLTDGSGVVVTTTADRSSTLILLATECQRREVSTQEGFAIWSTTYDSEKTTLIAVEGRHVDALLAQLTI